MSSIPENYKLIDKRVKIPIKLPEPKFKLRDDQLEIYNEVEDSCIINAKPSWGKTFTAIAIASKLGQKTLIVVDRVGLREQWESEINKVLGIKFGIIGSGKYEPDNNIVISNIQTLNKHMYKLASSFGTVIIDECHHIPASTFRKVLDISKARYKLGLSGTLKRKDSKHTLITDYIANTIYTPEDANKLTPSVLSVKSGIKLSAGLHIPWATTVNELVDNPEYFSLVLNLSKIMAESGHKVLVLSDRVEFLKKLHAVSKDYSVCITGSTLDRKELLKEFRDEKSVLNGSLNIFKEGINEPCLSCVILAAPIGNNDAMLEQIIGRIQRPYPGKLPPIVVDIILDGTTGKKQYSTRLGLYVQSGYKVTEVWLDIIKNFYMM